MKTSETFELKSSDKYEPKYLKVNLRFDDECGNGHKTFSITGETYYRKALVERNMASCGCIHNEIEKYAPKYKNAILYHLVSEDGPLYYVANTLYHIKQGNLDFARSSAVWPEATDYELLHTNEKTLLHRLPEIMVNFYNVLEEFGLITLADEERRSEWEDRLPDTLLPLLSDSELENIQLNKEIEKRSRLEAKAEKLEQEFERETSNKKYEVSCKAAILRAGHPVDNLIYYSHTDEWCFGWYEKVTEEQLRTFRNLCTEIKDQLLDWNQIELNNKLCYKIA
jgi:hypothetical protein